MLKIGLFTFGGGYAMISLLENEFVSRKKWLDGEEFLDLVTIAESTPGPIAINCSTYIGFRRMGAVGAIVATLGMCLPSFTIIYLISLFFNQFLAISWVAAAFRGIQVCVVYLILSAGLKMLKKMKKSPMNIIIMAITLIAVVLFSLFSVSFSSIFYILIFGAVGLLVYAISFIRAKGEENK
ncbi:MAG: chromate transporter [Clostridia bacterium]|nr:chromate transporter [Clostridia bacterium]